MGEMPCQFVVTSCHVVIKTGLLFLLLLLFFLRFFFFGYSQS